MDFFLGVQLHFTINHRYFLLHSNKKYLKGRRAEKTACGYFCSAIKSLALSVLLLADVAQVQVHRIGRNIQRLGRERDGILYLKDIPAVQKRHDLPVLV